MTGSAGCMDYRSAHSCGSGLQQQERGTGFWVQVNLLLARYRRWRVLARQRRELAGLSDRMLKDIGLSRVDALRESRRPFWQDPDCFRDWV